jgi:hypothetical protein
MGQFIQVGEWLPDLPEWENPGALEAKNVVADVRSYRSFPTAQTYSTSLGARCRGSIVARDAAGNYFTYVGDTSATYTMNGNSWSSVTAAAYTLGTEDWWEFCQFGQLVIGVNGFTDAPQALSVGAAAMAALTGSPPKAKHITTIQNHVVMANLSSTALGTAPQTVQWCAINNAASWTADAATLADSQLLPGNDGWIQRVTGGENFGLVFKERSVTRMTWVGSPLAFQFEPVLTNIGLYAPQALVSYQNLTFFLSEDGFKTFDGANLDHIGQNKVDRYFFNDLDAAYKYRVQAAIDPVQKIVAWAYPAAGHSGGNPNKILIFNYGVRRWSYIGDLNIEFLARTVTPATALDSLDTPYPSIDAMLISLDGSFFAGGISMFVCFDSSHRLSIFNGSAMPAMVDTTEKQLVGNVHGGFAYVTDVRPMVQGVSAGVTLAVGTRNLLTQSASFAAAVAPVSAGFCPVRSTARYHRFRLNTTTDFDHILGVDVEVKPDGVR